MIDGKKKCSICGEVLPSECFYANKKTISGLYSACKKCWDKRSHANYIKNKESYIRQASKRELKLRVKVLTYYGNGEMKCCKCGFNDIRALSIDHINGGGTKHRKIIKGNISHWLVSNNFPSGYQTLCMNCQWIKRQENKEMHSHII